MDRRIEDALRLLAEEFAKPLTLEASAKVVGFSASRFRHLFRQELGLPPMKYLRSVRMRHAQTLLQVTTMAVKAIASEVGYHDNSHFVREFEKETGFSPTRFRSQTGLNESIPLAKTQERTDFYGRPLKRINYRESD